MGLPVVRVEPPDSDLMVSAAQVPIYLL